MRAAVDTMSVPDTPKIYHIVHKDRIPLIAHDGVLLSDAEVRQRGLGGTGIGMSTIKDRRLNNALDSHPGLTVGACVPFYFCPRSIMLFVLHKANAADLTYRGGQGPIVHLEADLNASMDWAEANNRRWAFTLSNAGSFYFEDRCERGHLDQLNWTAFAARDFRDPAIKEAKQAEFLMEQGFPWELVERIGVRDSATANEILRGLSRAAHKPTVQILPAWYY